MSENFKLDEKDREIIRLLKEDAWQTHTKIGEAVHLSPSAVQRRFERLRAQGVITGAKAMVDPKAIDQRLRMFILMELHNDGHEQLEILVGQLKAHREVSHVDLTLGKFDILLTVGCVDTDAFSDFAMNTLNKNSNIKHCFTLTKLTTLI